MKKDYMVVSDNTDEEIFSTLKEARKRAAKLSKESVNVRIHKWIQAYPDDSDLTFDEDFEIRYENGKEVK